MPELDGVGFIKEQMARRPVPIVVVSVASESGELVLAALDAGAVDFVQKPTALATDRVLEIADELIEKVKSAAAARPGESAATAARAGRRAFVQRPAPTAVDIVVIGISTGGTAGAEAADSAAACRAGGADRDCSAHAGWLH